MREAKLARFLRAVIILPVWVALAHVKGGAPAVARARVRTLGRHTGEERKRKNDLHLVQLFSYTEPAVGKVFL